MFSCSQTLHLCTYFIILGYWKGSGAYRKIPEEDLPDSPYGTVQETEDQTYNSHVAPNDHIEVEDTQNAVGKCQDTVGVFQNVVGGIPNDATEEFQDTEVQERSRSSLGQSLKEFQDTEIQERSRSSLGQSLNIELVGEIENEGDDDDLSHDLQHSLDLSNETFERIERLCEESVAAVVDNSCREGIGTDAESQALPVYSTENLETEVSNIPCVKSKRVTWESNVKDISLDKNKSDEENRLNEERDIIRDQNLNLTNENTASASGDFTFESKLKATSESWDIEVSGFSSGTKKPSKRAEALRNARTQHDGEDYVPPRVLATANQIAQRKVLDLKRW